MKRVIACLAVLALASCATRHDKPGPLARGVRADARPDTIGIVLSWSPDQTLANFRNIDHIFTTHTIRRGGHVRALPRAAVQIDPVVVQSDGPAVSVEQLMEAERITGVIAVKDGEIVLERYAFGRGPDDPWISMSVAKSVTATLIGAAVKDGLIASIDDPVVRYIPELKGTAFDGVTIRHLMTMSSGVRWKEDYVDLTSDVALAGGEEMVGGVPPLVAYAKRLEREAKPGTRRKYQTIDADMLGIVLSRALKDRSLADYISEKIWQPFGMEADASWIVDKAGIERGGCCLSITLRDYARLGCSWTKRPKPAPWMFCPRVGYNRRGRRNHPSPPSTLSALATIGRSAKTAGMKRSGRMGSRSPFTRRSTWSLPSIQPV